jgi:hypothetical protein
MVVVVATEEKVVVVVVEVGADRCPLLLVFSFRGATVWDR